MIDRKKEEVFALAMVPEEKSTIKRPHSIILENRHNMTVAGVSDIDSFDEQTVVLFTDMGELTIKGFNLHINKLNGRWRETSIFWNMLRISRIRRVGFFLACFDRTLLGDS